MKFDSARLPASEEGEKGGLAMLQGQKKGGPQPQPRRYVYFGTVLSNPRLPAPDADSYTDPTPDSRTLGKGTATK